MYLALSTGHLEGVEKNGLVHTVFTCVKYFRVPFVYVSVNSYCHVFNVHVHLIVYGAIYGLGFSVHFDACADGVYQAVFPPFPNGLGTRLGCTIHMCWLFLYTILVCLLLSTAIPTSLFNFKQLFLILVLYSHTVKIVHYQCDEHNCQYH